MFHYKCSCCHKWQAQKALLPSQFHSLSHICPWCPTSTVFSPFRSTPHKLTKISSPWHVYHLLFWHFLWKIFIDDCKADQTYGQTVLTLIFEIFLYLISELSSQNLWHLHSCCEPILFINGSLAAMCVSACSCVAWAEILILIMLPGSLRINILGG